MENNEMLPRRWCFGDADWVTHDINRLYLHRSFENNDWRNFNEEKINELIFSNILTSTHPRWLIEIEAATEDIYNYLTLNQFENILIEYMINSIWLHPKKIRSMFANHDIVYNTDIINLINITANMEFNKMKSNGVITPQFFNLHTDTFNNLIFIHKIIEGANWLSGDVGKTIISKAVANNRGTDEEVKAQLRNRIVMQEDPVAIDERNIDRWSPIITHNFVTVAEYYRRSPGYVPESERRPATDILLEYNVLDETGLTVQSQYLNETSTIEPQGSLWITSGTILTITATDAAGNLTVKHYANDEGVGSEALTEIEDEGES